MKRKKNTKCKEFILMNNCKKNSIIEESVLHIHLKLSYDLCQHVRKYSIKKSSKFIAKCKLNYKVKKK